MPDQEGVPMWEKMRVLDVDDKAVLYVPLSSDNTSLSSLILVTVDGNNNVSVLRNFTNDYLKIYAYNSDYPADKRKFLMDTFLQMDFLCFKQQEFTNLPTDLYGGSAEYNRLNILEVTKENMNNGKFIYGSFCATIHACVNGCTLLTCDYDNCQHGGKCHVWKSCTNTVDWVDDPSTSYPSAPSCGPGCGGGGGGTPGSGGTPPKDLCALTGGNKPFYRMLTGCNDSGNTDIPGLDDPCLKTQTLLNDANAQQAIADVTEQAKKAANDINEGEIDRIEKNGQFTAADVSADHHVTFNNINGAKGIYHSHTFNGAKMHSPPDINFVLNLASGQTSASNYGDVYVGMIGAEKCYPAAAGCFRIRHYLIRFIGTTSDLATSFSEDQMKKFNKDYRDRAHELTEVLPYVDFLGDVLNNKGVEKLFFDTLAKMGLTGKVMLQRIDDDGTVNNINLDANGVPTAMPCP